MYKEKASTRLFMILFLIFLLNCFGKMSFSAVTASLVGDGIMTKTQAGTIGAFFWITYTIGQLLGSWAVNKFSPIKLIFWGMLATSVLEFVMPFCRSYAAMLVVWGINGFAQFGVYPAILLLVSQRVIPEHRHKALYYISYSYCAGAILSYFLTSVILKYLSWEYIFYIIGVIMLISCVLITYVEKSLYTYLPAFLPSNFVQSDDKSGENKWKIIFTSGMFAFFISAFIKSYLDTGIKTWIPTMLMEEYGASPSYTSLLTTGLLVVNLLGVGLSEKIYKKLGRNENFLLLVNYIVILPIMLLLINFKSMNMYVVTVIMTLSTVLMYGSGMAFLSYAPARFQKFGLTASLAGIVNSFAAGGNVFGVYLNGKIADLFNWTTLIALWNVFILMFILINVLVLKKWKRFVKETTED